MRESPRRNANGVTFEEWLSAARVGEERKVRDLLEVQGLHRLRVDGDGGGVSYRWRSREQHAAELLGADPAPGSIPARVGYEHLRLSVRRGRVGWRAGHDPTDYAAAPRPIPYGFGRLK